MIPSSYITDAFLLECDLANDLYHNYASDLPIIDYHNHLEAKDIWLDRSYQSIAEAWLKYDHYLWRAMRSVGIEEHFITGDASEYEKFEKWCETMPYLIGSPLYQWCHLELKRYFDLDCLINPKNCPEIWQHCNDILASGALSARNILIKNKVDTLCTTDDPLSDLHYHHALAESDFAVKVLPTFRTDALINVSQPTIFGDMLKKLSHNTGIAIHQLSDFQAALIQRIDYFHQAGCRLSDIGINIVNYVEYDDTQIEFIFQKMLSLQHLSDAEQQQWQSATFQFLGQQYHQRQWTMQVHIGVQPNVNQRRLQQIGAGTGFSIMHDAKVVTPLALLLDKLDQTNQLPQTVLYNLNPKDTWSIASLIGAFQDSVTSASKIQLGAAWWFNDHKQGMINQMSALANLGALGAFVGMLTDSRNLFSMSRHEYFRRVLCNLLAKWVNSGELPNDPELLKQSIENICFLNAKRYFHF